MLDLDEAVRCREAGWGGPILLLEGFFEPADLDIVDRYHLSTSVHHREQLDMLARARLSRKVDIMLKLNSGMNRLGFSPAAYPAAFERAQLLQQQGVLGSVGKMTHFACADGPQGVNEQLGLFNSVTHRFPGAVSVCNSAATLRFAEIAVGSETQAHCAAGRLPVRRLALRRRGRGLLRPAACPVAAFRDHRGAGTQGRRFGRLRRHFPRRARHAHRRRGLRLRRRLPRHASTGTPVMVAGVRTQLGRVSMDMLMVDLDPVPAAGVGSPVSLWGEDGPSVDEVAQAAGTIGYELLCAVAPRVPVIREP